MNKMTRKTFIAHMRGMLPEFEQDHEEHTGISDDELMPFEDWLFAILALFENTRT